MANTRRVVRQVRAEEYHTFEEERWPVNVALLLCAGVAAGLTLAVSDFDSTNWLENGWVRLSALVVTTGVLISLASFLPGRRLRRAIQFSAVLALLAHILVVVLLYNQRIEYLEEMVQEETPVFETVAALPDYHEPAEQESFEKPVEADVAEVEQSALTVSRQQTEQEMPQERQPTPEPGITPELVPSTIEKTELAETARSASDPSELSRSMRELKLTAQQSIDAPKQELAPTPDAITAAPQQQTRTAVPELGLPQTIDDDTQPVAVETSVAEIARRELLERPTESFAASVPERSQMVQPELDQTAVAPSPPAIEQPAIASEAPNVEAVERQSLVPSLAAQATAEYTASTAPVTNSIDASRVESSDAPEVSSAPTPSTVRATTNAQSIAIEALEAPQVAVPSDTPGSSPAPSEFAVTRSTTDNAAPAAVLAAGNATRAEPAPSATSAPSRPNLARSRSSDVLLPQVDNTGGAKTPGRSVGAIAVAQTEAETPRLPTGADVGPPGIAATAPTQGSVPKSRVTLPTRATALPTAELANSQTRSAAPTLVGPPSSNVSRQPDAQVPSVAASGLASLARKSSPAKNITPAPVAIGEPASLATVAATPPTATALSPRAVPLPQSSQALGTGPAALPVEIAKMDGPGGLRVEAQPTVGAVRRLPRSAPDLAHSGVSRFIQKSPGGPLAIDGRAREPAAAYQRRRSRTLDPAEEDGQPVELTERAVELGLEFLARHQAKNGSWSLHNYGAGKPGYEQETSQLRSDTAATGLALLAFLGAGYDHYDDKYAPEVRKAIDFLVKNQKPDGDLFLPMDDQSNKSVWLYSHGIATIALCEAVGMTGDDDLRAPAQKAIDFIVAAQHKQLGGWRYAPGQESDTSVSGWQLMALKSGELAGLKVPPDAYRRVERWLDLAESTPGGQTQYAYNPLAPAKTATIHGRKPTPATTSMGLLMRLYTGWNRADPRMKSGCDFLLSNPDVQDSYYWYYATQLMFHMKGDYWKQWNSRLHPLLVSQQVQNGRFAGSWDPRLPAADRWGPHAGRIYVTTLNLLSLEVYYRHLPIYEQTAK